MTSKLKDFITVAVENAFQTRYECNICKCYLYKHLLINPETNEPYNNRQIGHIIGLDHKKVGDYLFHMAVFKQGKENVFLLKDFKLKFDRIEQQCKEYAYRLTIEKGIEILEAPTARLKSKRLELINEINWN